MRKYLFIVMLITMVCSSFAQTNTFPASGNVGIGTVNPVFNLQVKGASVWDSSTILAITNNAVDFGRANIIITGRIQDQNDSWNFGSIARNSIVFAQNAALSHENIGESGDEKMSIQLEGNSNALGFLSKQNGSNPIMILAQNGFVGIGTTSPAEKLAVNGNIRAKEIKVENANWPDYVFTKDYALPSLQQTEQHIKEKGHLPGIPSAEEVKANGIDLGEMNAKLLQKIEELTLHLIEQNKKIETQSLELSGQKKLIEQLIDHKK